QVIATQEQEIAANKAANEAQDQQIAASQAEVDKRFSELADYDVKEEITILFDVDNANLSDKAKADIQAAAAKAKTYKGYLIQVAGYADSTGSAKLNQNLSDRRAEAVANYLRQSCDVGISRVLAPVAMSTAKPVAANESAQGRAENRRVVVKIAVNRGIAQ
ncbi:MAG TPA: OmpA family protein, partial [Methylophilaceae bacterium]|nr:OmpA family protein [Methylophilaceae bacterium]